MIEAVNCPDPGVLEDLLRGRLAEEEGDRLAVHLDTCTACRRALDELTDRLPFAPETIRGCAADTGTAEAELEEIILKHISPGPYLERPEAAAPEERPYTLDFLAPRDDPEHLGRLGPYQIVEVIGRGAMGVVLKGHDPKLNRIVAIKVLAPELAANATARRRFLREAQAAAAVSHDHVVTIHAVDEAERLPYLVMEYVDGRSLQQRIDEEGPLEVREILRIGMQMACGLAAAHAQGLIHRDIKPSNIMLENSVERVKITDFGLARAIDDVRITRTGEMAGTPQYMSPEQAAGQPMDCRSDLFSLGSVLYAMCTGRSPFRAECALGVLRRVADDDPRPIRQVNPDIPEWLVVIVEQLLAKEPAHRFQEAKEVADLLGRHLAHLQHPSLVAAPPPLKRTRPSGVGAKGPQTGRKGLAKRRWLLGGLFVALLLAGLGLSEATGMTHLAAAVLRIATGTGTLVVEVDDPGVSVTIDGQELVITGAGPQEVRLRPGQYRVQATKDGRLVQQELVTITRGGREVVKVSLETERTPEAAPPSPRPGAFVVLGGKGVPERKFDTLGEAVLGSNDGDTIEIRGHGPFVTHPINIARTALTIRAGAGFWPVIQLSAEDSQAPAMIEANVPLDLEGLEFRRFEKERRPEVWHQILIVRRAFHAANCRFLSRQNEVQIAVRGAGPAELRNCEFLSQAQATSPHGSYPVEAVDWCRPGRDLLVENCLLTASLIKRQSLADPGGGCFRLEHNTFRTGWRPFRFEIVDDDGDAEGFAKADWTVKALEVDASDNVFDASPVFEFMQHVKAVLSPGDAEACLTRMVGWLGERNAYSADGVLLDLTALDPSARHLPLPKLPPGLAGWKQLWAAAEKGSVEGPVRFEGGDLLAKTESDLEGLTPDDFRLRPDSAGYHAGPDGKDLGADVSLVGPDAAYERWKRTPEYQRWLEETASPSTVADIAVPAMSEPEVPTIDEVRRFDGPHDSIWRVAFSPDGHRALSAEDDRTVRLWDVATGEELRRFGDESARIMDVTFSPDGGRILAACSDAVIRLWDMESGEELVRCVGHEPIRQGVWCVRFSPDGGRIVSGGFGKTIRIWDAATGEEFQRLEGLTSPVYAVDFSPDGSGLISGCGWALEHNTRLDRTVHLWDVASGQQSGRFPVGSFVEDLEYLPDGRRAVVATRGGLALLNLEARETFHQFSDHHAWFIDLAVTADGRRMVSGSTDGVLAVWDVESGVCTARCRAHKAAIRVAISADGQWALTGAQAPDKTMRLWRLPPLPDAARPAHGEPDIEEQTESVRAACTGAQARPQVEGDRGD